MTHSAPLINLTSCVALAGTRQYQQRQWQCPSCFYISTSPTTSLTVTWGLLLESRPSPTTWLTVGSPLRIGSVVSPTTMSCVDLPGVRSGGIPSPTTGLKVAFVEVIIMMYDWVTEWLSDCMCMWCCWLLVIQWAKVAERTMTSIPSSSSFFACCSLLPFGWHPTYVHRTIEDPKSKLTRSSTSWIVEAMFWIYGDGGTSTCLQPCFSHFLLSMNENTEVADKLTKPLSHCHPFDC